jgi:disulfide oxidoreductase YuzD
VVLSITRGMQDAVLRLILGYEQAREQLHYVDVIVDANAASAEAIERVLGATSACLNRPTAEDVKAWLGVPEEKATPIAASA